LIFSPDAEGCPLGFGVLASIPSFSVRSAILPLVLMRPITVVFLAIKML
jgi:hypothetical protein